jgi:hypothetical protein
VLRATLIIILETEHNSEEKQCGTKSWPGYGKSTLLVNVICMQVQKADNIHVLIISNNIVQHIVTSRVGGTPKTYTFRTDYTLVDPHASNAVARGCTIPLC